jgi:hypothetical protein
MIREAIALDILHFFHVISSRNFADVLTKPVDANTFKNMVRPILFRVAWRERSRGFVSNYPPESESQFEVHPDHEFPTEGGLASPL